MQNEKTETTELPQHERVTPERLEKMLHDHEAVCSAVLEVQNASILTKLEKAEDCIEVCSDLFTAQTFLIYDLKGEIERLRKFGFGLNDD